MTPLRPSVARARESEAVRLAGGFLIVTAAEVWISFRAGGFFAGSTAIATVAAGVALVVWLMSSRHPFHGLSPALGAVLSGLTLFALWTLCSQWWSHEPAHAVIEFDRALLYLLVAAVAGLATNARRRRALLLAVLVATTVVCTCGLITRLLPEIWSVTSAVNPDRLSYPVSYWNTLGMVGAVGIIAAFHFAASRQEHPSTRALAAAATPLLTTAVLLTFSRASLVMLIVGLLLYLVLARQKASITALVAVVPAIVAAGAAYASPGVVAGPMDPRAVADGHVVAPIVLGCVVIAALTLLAARRLLEPRLVAWTPSRRAVQRVAAATLVGVVIALVAVDAPSLASRAISSFVNGDEVPGRQGDIRTRLVQLGNNGHLEHWRVGIEVFGNKPLLGAGAGSYADSWARYRRANFDVNDGHSLVVEVLSELGAVGGALIVFVLLALLIGGARRIRGPDRALHAALLTIVTIWMVRAQVDWDWEMPALTAACLACGAALVGGRSAAVKGGPWPPPLARLIASIGLLLLLTTPLAVARSQRDLDAATAAVTRGSCGSAIGHALASSDAMSSRPEPFQILAYCDSRLGRGALALDVARAAVRRDPNGWRVRYYLAIMQAREGEDPRPALRMAREMNPLSEFLKEVSSSFDTSRRETWIAHGRTAPLPL